MSKPGYREQGKARAAIKKNNFAINPEQMEYERRKVLEQMSTKVDQKSSTIWQQLQQQKNQNTLTKKETKESQPCAFYHSVQGFSHPVWRSWHKKD